MTEDYVCPYGDLCDFSEEDWKQYTGGDAATGGLSLNDAKYSGAVLSIGEGGFQAENIALGSGGAIVLQDGGIIEVKNNFLNLGIVEAANGLEVRVNGQLVNAGSFESKEGSIMLKAKEITEIKASNKATKGSISYKAESMHSLGSFKLAGDQIIYDIGSGGLTIDALHIEKVITNNQWHNYKLIQREIIGTADASVANQILIKAQGYCIGNGALLIGGDKVNIECKKFEWNTKTSYTKDEYSHKKSRWYGSTSITQEKSVSKTSRAGIALEEGEKKELVIKAEECRFEGALLPEDGKLNILCDKWLFIDHVVKEWEKSEVVKRGFLSPSIPVKQLFKDPKAELLGMIPAVGAARDIVNMKGPFDLKGPLKLVSEVPVMKEWVDKITNAKNTGDLMKSAGSALLDKYAKATFHIGYQRITTYQETEYTIPSEFNAKQADIDIKTGEVKGSAMKAKKLTIKIEKELILRAGRNTQYHYTEEEKMTFDIGIGTDGVSFGMSESESEQELKKMQHKKSILEGEHVHITLQSNAKLEIVGAQINGKKIEILGNKASIEIQDVIDKSKTQSSHFGSSIGVTVAWNGAVMPYGSISAGESLKNSELVKFISGIQGDNVEIVAEKIKHSAGAIKGKDNLHIESQEVIETKRPVDVNQDRGYSIASGFKMGAEKNEGGKKGASKATYYAQAEYWKDGEHYSLFANERTAEGFKDIGQMLSSVEKKVEQELVEPVQKSDDTTSNLQEEGKPEEPKSGYLVVEGDTLSKIAAKSGKSVDDWLAANPHIANKDKIPEGRYLNIPEGDAIWYYSSDNDSKKQTGYSKGNQDGNKVHAAQKNTEGDERGGARKANTLQQPTIELVVTTVVGKKTFEITDPDTGIKHKYVTNDKKHSFTIFTDSYGKKTIITGFPENKNMITGNLEVIDVTYSADNKKLLADDWAVNAGKYHADKKYTIIQTVVLKDEQEFQSRISAARKAVNFIETGNNGGRFDYDICVSDKCWGANSNTVQYAIHKAMGNEIPIPKDFDLPGIHGKFYEGPLDDLLRKIGENMQNLP